jgi:hypothetical protein
VVSASFIFNLVLGFWGPLLQYMRADAFDAVSNSLSAQKYF